MGAQIRKMRNAQGMTQEMLVAKCNIIGSTLTRGTLAKIEAQIRGASDVDMFALSRALKVRMEDLYPKDFAAQLKRDASRGE